MDGWTVKYGRHKNNSPEDEELNGWHETTLPRDGRHKNNSPKGGTCGELDGRQEDNSPNGWMARK